MIVLNVFGRELFFSGTALFHLVLGMLNKLYLAGVDTNGGVRIPAGYCGLLGFRPSHGSISHVGIIPVSASLDTVGM